MAVVMLDDLDAFKVWLTKTLTPICDADPQALAKYVIALIKKEKSAEELKPLCLSQLDVFLQEKTKDFVDTLFLCLKNKTYLPPRPAEPVKQPEPAESNVTENRLSTSDKDIPNNEDDKANKRRIEDVRNRLGPEPRRRSRSPERARSPLRDTRGSRDRTPNRDRSPLRDRERSPLRARSPRDRSPYRNRRSVFDRLQRRRSPGRGPRFGGRSDVRRRRPSLPRSPGPRRSPLRRSRSPRPRSPRPRSPVRPRSLSSERRRNVVDRRRSLSPRDRPQPSRSPQRRFRPRSWSMSSDGLSSFEGSRSRSRSRTPTKNSGGGSSVRNAGGKTPDSRGSTPRDYSPYNRENREVHDARDYTNKPPAKPRCRDYDEKGFCMRGDLCPYDHGADPVVVDDVSLPSVLQLNQGSAPAPRLPGPPTLGPRLIGPPGSMPPTSMPFRGPQLRGPLASLPINLITQPPPPPPSVPGTAPFPGAGIAVIAGKPPPPPGTVPVQIPVASQGYTPGGPAPTLPSYQPEPYNPEAPGIRSGPPVQGYFPTPAISGAARAMHQAASHGPVSLTTSTRTVQGNLVSITSKLPVASVPSITEPAASTSNRTVLLGKRQMEEQALNGASHSPSKRPHFDPNRLGPKRNFIPNNTILELRKVPFDKNNIGSINAHFSKFGLITNLQVCYKGDPEAAVVTFATPHQAQAAYKCTEPIFNNRFVKVFWHNPGTDNAENHSHRPPVKERLGTVIPPANKMSLSNVKKPQPTEQPLTTPPTGLSKTVFNPDAAPQSRAVAIVTAAQKAKAAQSHKIEIAKKKLEIQRKKQSLLQEQLKQQKMLIAKLESNKSMPAEDKKSILKTIKVLADSIEKLKCELLKRKPGQHPAPVVAKQNTILATRQPQALPTNPGAVKPVNKPIVAAPAAQLSVDIKSATPADAPAPPQSPKEKAIALMQTKQKTQKAILDTELDIISKQNSGLDTSSLRQRVADLKREAAALGLLGPGGARSVPGAAFAGSPSRGGAMGRGGLAVGRGRGGYNASHVLDRRPKQLHVSFYTLEEKVEVVNHLASFGEIESIVHDDSVPSMMIDFKTRQDAEQAARDGQGFKKKRLVMAWGKVSSPPGKPPVATSRRKASMDLLQPGDGAGVAAVGGEDEPASGEASISGSGALSLEDPLDGIDEDALLGLDEEDDDEDADKSWKR